MKEKIVLWALQGSEESAEKVLLALELLRENNEVLLRKIASPSATEELFEQLRKEWKEDQATIWPDDDMETQSIELSAAKGLLPEGLELGTEDADFLEKSKNEWLFAVLSYRLYKQKETQLQEIEERAEAIESFDKGIWDEIKDFQDDLINQLKEKNISKQEFDQLKDIVNVVFNRLKELRRLEDERFEQEAKLQYEGFVKRVEEVEEACNGNKPDFFKLFEKLKALQKEFRSIKLTRKLRNNLWDRIDKAFKFLKEKRYPNAKGSAVASASVSDQGKRLESRIEGLLAAIDKMQSSVNRDKKEHDYIQDRNKSGQGSQIESQLREVKGKIIAERLQSKQAKLDDMHKTLEELKAKEEKLQSRIAKEKAKAEKEAEKAAETELQTPTTEEEQPQEEQTLVAQEPEAKEQETASEPPVVEPIKLEEAPEEQVVTEAPSTTEEETTEKQGEE